MNKKLRTRLALRIAMIFAIFVAVIIIANSTLLESYYLFHQKGILRRTANEILGYDFSDTETVAEQLSDIEIQHKFDIIITSADGSPIYTSAPGGIFGNGRENPMLGERQIRDDLFPTRSERISENEAFEMAKDPVSSEGFVVYHASNESVTVELRLRRQYLSESAAVAGTFTIIIASVCLVAALIWTALFTKKFTRPIIRMNEITRDMAKLNFERRIIPDTKDEIGQLAVSINTLSSELDRTLRDLKEKNARLEVEIEDERRIDRMRQEFVANVSHELKTPISIIRGYAEGLRAGIGQDKTEEYCGIIMDESDRMTDIITGLLRLSVYESGKAPLNIAVTDMAAVMRAHAQDIRAQLDEKGARLTDEMPLGLPLLADEYAIGFVAANYLSNAASHVAPGGYVKLSAKDMENAVRIEVSNSGEHIHPDKMELIWQSFYRGDSSHKREENRFGLGLSIAKAIMDMHENACGVYNTPDGVCFWFELKKPDVR